MTDKLIYICPHCGSNSIACDASARFNLDTQQWELSTIFDYMTCQGCDRDFTNGIDPTIIETSPSSKGREAGRFEVQHETVCQGWINCWQSGDEPHTFTTYDEAQKELDAFIKERNEDPDAREGLEGDQQVEDPSAYRIALIVEA